MKRFPRALALIVGAAIALTATIAVNPSYAVTAPRTLPAGQTLYSISCDSSQADAQLTRVDAATAVGTLVGSGTIGGGECAYQPAWDAATQKAYFVDSDVNELRVMDTTTGVSTVVGPFKLGTNDQSVKGFAISPAGVAYALYNGILYSVDLGTAALTSIGGNGSIDAYALAFNPVSGTLYGMTSAGELYTYDTTSGAPTPVTTLALPEPTNPSATNTHVYSMQFDSTGMLWLENDGPNAELWSVDISVPASVLAVYQGDYKTGNAYYYNEALLIVPFVLPVFTSAAEAAGKVGSAFTFTATATGGAGTTFSITSGTLPAGLVLDPATGVISGTPTGAGASAFTITATNPVGSTPQSFTLAIAAADGVHLPVVSG